MYANVVIFILNLGDNLKISKAVKIAAKRKCLERKIQILIRSVAMCIKD
jgi:hypothetical protein